MNILTEIRPISDLRNNFNAISEICHEEAVPVYITKNGKQNLVVLSHELYMKQQNLLELYQKLAVSEQESLDPNIVKKSHTEVIANLRSKINDRTK